MPWIELAVLLENYDSGYGGTWAAAFEYLTCDPVEAATVAALREELRSDGHFAEPIYLTGNVVGNGMHRICAAWAEGRSRIEYTTESTEPEVGQWVEVYFTADRLDEKAFETLIGVLRSFTVDGRWVECVGLGSINGQLEAVFTWPADQVNTLYPVLEDLAAKAGYPVVIEGSVPWPSEEDLS